MTLGEIIRTKELGEYRIVPSNGHISVKPEGIYFNWGLTSPTFFKFDSAFIVNLKYTTVYCIKLIDWNSELDALSKLEE